MKRLSAIIPTIHFLSILLFFLVIEWMINKETEGKSEVFQAIYNIGFFLSNGYLAVILGMLLFIPIPLLAYSFIKKRKDIRIGASISLVISAIIMGMIVLS